MHGDEIGAGDNRPVGDGRGVAEGGGEQVGIDHDAGHVLDAATGGVRGVLAYAEHGAVQQAIGAGQMRRFVRRLAGRRDEGGEQRYRQRAEQKQYHHRGLAEVQPPLLCPTRHNCLQSLNPAPQPVQAGAQGWQGGGVRR